MLDECDQETVQSSGSEFGSLILFTFFDVLLIKLLLLGFKLDVEEERFEEVEAEREWSPR